MARYIDADKFAERIRLSPAFKKMAFEGDLLQRVVLDILGNAPATDVVEVVRCEKCKYRNFNSESLQTKCMRRPYAPIYVEPNDFCSCGERSDT